MEEWEEAEWAEREREIARVQEERLDVLKRAIDAREAEAEALAETRLKRMRAGMLADKHEKFASIQTKRVKHLRKLAARRDRERVPPEGTRAASAADAHANYASTVYAPLSREGGAPRDGPPPYAPDPKVESRSNDAHIRRAGRPSARRVRRRRRRRRGEETRRNEKNAEQRRAAVAEALLDATAKNLDEARRVAGGNAAWVRVGPRRRIEGARRRRREERREATARSNPRPTRKVAWSVPRRPNSRAAHGRRGERVSVRGCGDVTALSAASPRVREMREGACGVAS